MRFWSTAAGATLIFGVGILAGVLLVVMLPGMPWISTVPDPVNDLDLGAQRSMAAAAWWMVVISGGAAIVGGASLYLIARTLLEARRSASAAEAAVAQAEATLLETRVLGRAQSRAYLALAKMQFSADAEDQFFVEWTIHNAGQSPARQLSIQLEFDYFVKRNSKWLIESNETLVRFLPDLPAGLSSTDEEFIFLVLPMDAPPSHGERIEVHGELRYWDVFGQSQTDAFAFRATYQDGDDWKELSPMQRRPDPLKHRE